MKYFFGLSILLFPTFSGFTQFINTNCDIGSNLSDSTEIIELESIHSAGSEEEKSRIIFFLQLLVGIIALGEIFLILFSDRILSNRHNI